jgi:hypothetical protein
MPRPQRCLVTVVVPARLLCLEDLDEVDMGPGELPLPSVINVGAVDSEDLRANFSNYGR